MLTSQWFEKYKPAARVRSHLLLAGLMWSLVGAGLLTAGLRWSTGPESGVPGWAIAGAVLLGVAKSRWILDRTATRIVTRIRSRGEGRCLGGFLSLRSWALVGLMVGLGRFLRSWSDARSQVGLLYVLVGVGLLLSSRLPWTTWWRAC